jgi:hypothetical protein
MVHDRRILLELIAVVLLLHRPRLTLTLKLSGGGGDKHGTAPPTCWSPTPVRSQAHRREEFLARQREGREDAWDRSAHIPHGASAPFNIV